MKAQDFMNALGGISQEKLDALAEWQDAKTPVSCEETVPEKRITQTAAVSVPNKRSRGTMKQKTKQKTAVTRLFPWNIGIGAAVAACALIAVSIGKEVIGHEKEIQTGSNVGTSISEQISENSANETMNAGTDDKFYAWYWTKYHGNDIELDGKTITLIRTAEDGAPYLTHSGQQNETDLATMLSADWLENGGTEFTDPVNHAYISGTGEPHDIIFIGVPAKDLPQNMISWDYHNGTVTRSGKLHLDFSVMTLCDDAMAVMPVDKQYDDDTNFYYFISVPEGVMPDLTGWELSFTEYHSDAMPDENVIDKPDEIGTDGMTRAHAWLCSLPEYQDWESSVVGSKYITWENDVPVSQEKCAVEQNASFLHEPIELIDKLAVCGGSDYVMMKVPKEGAVHVLRSVADAEDCCQYTDDKNVAGENFDFRKKLTEEVFAEYDVLYFAFKDNQLPLYLYTYDLAGGSIAADGTTLHLSFHALMYDPEHLPSNVLYSYDDYEPDWNTYYFYTVPKGSLPDLSAITVSFEEYPIGAIPDELLTSTGETVEITDNGYITKHTKLQEYLETTQEYLDYVMSMPKPKFITWENSTEMLTDDCTEDNRGQLMPD